MSKSAVKSVFSLDPLPAISQPKPPFFVRFGHFGGKIHLFRGVFLFSSREILARNLCFRLKNQFDGEFMFGIRPNFDFGRRRKEESRRFSPPPPLHSKNTSRLSLKTPPLFATSSLVSLKTSLPSTKSISPYAQDTRLRVCTRPRSQRVCHFCLHPSPRHATNCRSIDCVWRQTLPSPSPSPQQSEIQHVARLPLQKNRWRQKGEAFTHNSHLLNDLRPKGEEVKAKIEKHWTRARAREGNWKALRLIRIGSPLPLAPHWRFVIVCVAIRDPKRQSQIL